MEKEKNRGNNATEETTVSKALNKADSAFRKIKSIVSSIAGIVFLAICWSSLQQVV